jgi:hypothetical protein
MTGVGGLSVIVPVANISISDVVVYLNSAQCMGHRPLQLAAHGKELATLQ